MCCVALVSCGSDSRPPTSPPVTSPPAVPPAATTSGRVVNALDQGQGIAGASVVAEFVTSTTTDSSGQFTLQTAVSSLAPLIRISSPAIVERQVYVKVPGDPVLVTTMPSSINLTYFNEMCRTFGNGITRWAAAPVLYVETSALAYGSRISTGEVVPDDHVQRTIAELRQVIPILSAGRFADFAAIEYRTTPAGTASRIPEGAIGLTWQTKLLETFGHVAYGGREQATLVTQGMLRGEVALDRDWHLYGLPAGSRRDVFNVVQHELGHAMGYSHTKTSPSFMYEVFLMTISSLDRQAFEIYMQRPSGNRAPDVDPNGSSANLAAPGPRGMVVERCASLKR